jgi:biotin operon repressor
MTDNVGEIIPGEELAEVAGISEWARRLRELRAEGMEISQPEVGMYRLDQLP